MLKLPQVTLIAMAGVDKKGNQKALDESCKGIEWGDVVLAWDVNINSIDKWNYSIIYDLWRHVDTPYAMLIHADGYVIRPDLWNDDWLNYDYIGAPWPLPQDDFSYRTPKGELVRVGNSVSLRSRKILELPTKLGLEWKRYYGNTNEDGFLCCHNRDILIEHGCRFADIEVAKHFSKEHSIPENAGLDTFAFHRVDV